jgi:hypothetical protein
MDTIRVQGPLDVSPTTLVTHAANAQAALDVMTASDVPTALEVQLDCDGMSASLLNQQMYAYAMCDKACVKQLCVTGLVSMWSAARDASQNSGDTFEISVNASGQAKVGDVAEPISLAGTWSGNVKGGQFMTSTMEGAIKAAKGMAPN